MMLSPSNVLRSLRTRSRTSPPLATEIPPSLSRTIVSMTNINPTPTSAKTTPYPTMFDITQFSIRSRADCSRLMPIYAALPVDRQPAQNDGSGCIDGDAVTGEHRNAGVHARGRDQRYRLRNRHRPVAGRIEDNHLAVGGGLRDGGGESPARCRDRAGIGIDAGRRDERPLRQSVAIAFVANEAIANALSAASACRKIGRMMDSFSMVRSRVRADPEESTPSRDNRRTGSRADPLPHSKHDKIVGSRQRAPLARPVSSLERSPS